MNYKERARKLITLPSGATCTIRKMTVADFVSIGNIPGEYPEEVRLEKRQPTEKEKQDAYKRGAAMQRVIFTRCISPILAEGKKYTIVDKPTGQAADSEIEIDAWDQDDAAFVALQVMEFSGLRKGGVDSDATFRADKDGSSEPAPISEVLPRPAEPAKAA